MKKFLLILLGIVTLNLCAFAIESDFKNSLLKVDYVKTGNDSYNIRLFTQKPYGEPIKVIKKTNTSYYILLPETFHSVGSVAPFGDIKSTEIKLFPYAGQFRLDAVRHAHRAGRAAVLRNRPLLPVALIHARRRSDTAAPSLGNTPVGARVHQSSSSLGLFFSIRRRESSSRASLPILLSRKLRLAASMTTARFLPADTGTTMR